MVSAHRDVTAWFRRDYTSTSAASAPDSAHAIARTISGSLLAGGGSRSDTLNCIDADGAGRPTGIAIGIEAMRAAGDAGMYAIDIAIAVDIDGAFSAAIVGDGPIIDGDSGGESITAA